MRRSQRYVHILTKAKHGTEKTIINNRDGTDRRVYNIYYSSRECSN